MKKMLKSTSLLLALIMMFTTAFTAKITSVKAVNSSGEIADNDYLMVNESGRLVNKLGGEVVLRGINLGGWMIQESWMTPVIGADRQWANLDTIHAMEDQGWTQEQIQDVFDTYQDNWITELDFDYIQSMGYNCVRIPFWYRNFMSDEAGTWITASADDNPGFKRLDWAIEQAEKRGMYVILDLHGAVGGQSMDHCSGTLGLNELYTNQQYEDATVKLWKGIAERYKGNPVVAAYDLLNEPQNNNGYTGTNSWAPGSAKALEETYRMYDILYRAVRSVDPDHIISVEAIWSMKCLPDPAVYGWTNMMYQMHLYDSAIGDPNVEGETIDYRVQELVNARDNWGVAIYTGEFNNGDSNQAYAYEKYNENNISWTAWTYKLSGQNMGNWSLVTNTSASLNANPTGTAQAPAGSSTIIASETYEQVKAKWGAAIRTFTDDSTSDNLVFRSGVQRRNYVYVTSGDAAVAPTNDIVVDEVDDGNGYTSTAHLTGWSRYEAEEAKIVGVSGSSAGIESQSFYSGGKAAGGINSATSLESVAADWSNINYVSFDNVTVTEDGTYKIKILYNGNDDKTILVKVNGGENIVVSLPSRAGGSWNTLFSRLIEVDLKAGINTIEVSGTIGNQGWANIDCIDVKGVANSSDTEPEPDPDPTFGTMYNNCSETGTITAQTNTVRTIQSSTNPFSSDGSSVQMVTSGTAQAPSNTRRTITVSPQSGTSFDASAYEYLIFYIRDTQGSNSLWVRVNGSGSSSWNSWTSDINDAVPLGGAASQNQWTRIAIPTSAFASVRSNITSIQFGEWNNGTYQIDDIYFANEPDAFPTEISVNDLDISDISVSYEYTGSQITPSPIIKTANGVTLQENTHYRVTYSENTNVSDGGEITITGRGMFTGIMVMDFTIQSTSLVGATVQLESDGAIYDNTAKLPVVSEVKFAGETTGLEASDFTLSYYRNYGAVNEEELDINEDADFIEAGVITVVVTGTGNYNGTATVEFIIIIASSDKSDLEMLVQYIEKDDSNVYTLNSWNDMLPALEKAREVLEDEYAEDSAIEEALSKLAEKYLVLKKRAVKSELDMMIEKAQGILDNADEYAPSSIAGLEAAIEKAQLVSDNLNLSVDDQAVVDQALKDLTEEVTKARHKAYKAELTILVETALAIETNLYTEASVRVMTTALTEAMVVLDDQDAIEAEVNNAYIALNAAINGLIEIPNVPGVDKSGLESLYDANKDKANDGYTEASWKAFEDALKNVQDVLLSENATQEQVDAAKAVLQAAIDNLGIDDSDDPKETDQEDDKTTSTKTSDNSPIIQLALFALVSLGSGAFVLKRKIIRK